MIATYRIQLVPEFAFAEVEDLLPYFQQLGVSHLYFSPITEATAGSTHGYDVIDHNAVREEFGGREALDRLIDAARQVGLEVIFDFAPNHAGIGPHNEAWQDVLAHGAYSSHAKNFDIDWEPLEETLRGKVLLPFLGKPYGEALDENEIRLTYQDDRFYASYFENRFALCPKSYADLIEAALPLHERTDKYFDLKELQEGYASLAPEDLAKAKTLRHRLQSLSKDIDWDSMLAEYPQEELHALLEKQFWRLAYWKTASYEINYRRFFNVDSLVALQMEDSQVFWNTHRLISDLATEERIAGLRIDHIDGLSDPHTYLKQLREVGVKKVWVEKILARGEKLPEDWPVEGTTGYEFINDLMSVLLQPAGLTWLRRVYQRFVSGALSFEDEVHTSKRLIVETSLASELYRLAYELNRLSKADYHTRDFTLGALRSALVEMVAALGRYRTYLPHEQETSREIITQAAYRAGRRTPAFELSVYDFIASVLLGEVPEELQERQRAWTARFQQYTGPVAAKGVEDTAFYRYLPLVALNEVGGEPQLPEHPLQAFHSHAAYRARHYPLNLLATATHDHKRGEDTRARMVALGGVPELWEQTVQSLSAIGESYRSFPGPTRYDEYLFLQVLAALWEANPPEELTDRLCQYMLKASRESKRNTSWTNPDEAYEKSLDDFVRGVLSEPRTAKAIAPLATALAEHGFYNSISQVVLKLTNPGVPDLYQGCELLDLSLVDPDNRRPVDYPLRQRMLNELQPLLRKPDGGAIRELVESYSERAKLYVTAQLLRLRGEQPELFQNGGYQPLELAGQGAEQWIAYARQHDQGAIVVVVSRFPANSSNRGEATIALPAKLQPQQWCEVLSGTTIAGSESFDLQNLPLPWGVLQKR